MNQDSKLHELVEGFLDGKLDDARLSQLKQALQEDPALRASMAMELRLRGLLRARGNDSSSLGDAVFEATDGFSPKSHENGIMRAISAKANSTVPFISPPKSSHRFARAAAWLGAFTWYGNKAQAAGTAATLLMTKTATTTAAITVSLLLVGGGSLHLLHKGNQEAIARVEQLQARKDATAGDGPLQASKGTIPGSTAERRAARTSPNSNPASRMLATNTAYLNRLGENARSMNLGGALMTTIKTDVVNEMDEMDLVTLNQLLTLAQENDANLLILSLILDKIAAKSPADATVVAASIVTNATTFDESLSSKLGGYFRDWMVADRSAAEQWYASAMASGELLPKSIPGAGRDSRMPDRTIMQNHFKALLDLGSEQAISMVGEMSDGEVAYAMSSLSEDYEKANTAPGFISRIVRELPPQRQNIALSGHVDFMAKQDFTRASTWLDAVDIGESAQASLLSRAARVAYKNQKLSQSEALKIIDGLPDSLERKNALREIEGN